MSGSLRPIEHKNTQEYWEIPESKNDSQKYPIVYLISPTRPDPDQLPGICSNTRPDIEKPYPFGTGVKLLFMKNLMIIT